MRPQFTARREPKVNQSTAWPLLVSLFAPVAIFSANPLMTLASLGTLGFIWIGAFRSPVRTIMAAFVSVQWLQVSIIVWLAEFYRIDLSLPQSTAICTTCHPLSQVVVTSSTEETIIFALAGIASLVIGTRVLGPRISSFRPSVAEFRPLRLFLCYLALLAIARISGPFVGGGLAQPLISLGSLRFAIVVLLIYEWITTRRGLLLLIGLFVTEIIIGFVGFFAGFKDIFIVAGTASLIVAKLYWKRVRLVLMVAGPILLVLASVWTVIKPKYREFLRQGSREQIVATDISRSLDAVQNMSGNISADDFFGGMMGAVLRLSYVEIPSYAMKHVPNVIPYQYGALWGEAIKEVVTPRLLFPDKPALPSDSVRTNHFTGKRFETIGTSVSLGYFIESYIDFGIIGGLVLLFILGMFYALIARHILYLGRRYSLTFCIAVLIVLFLPVQQFEISNIKLIPGILWQWIVCSIVVWFVWPLILPWLCWRSSTQSRLHSGSQLTMSVGVVEMGPKSKTSV
jgi:hypothetical protein